MTPIVNTAALSSHGHVSVCLSVQIVKCISHQFHHAAFSSHGHVSVFQCLSAFSSFINTNIEISYMTMATKCCVVKLMKITEIPSVMEEVYDVATAV